MSAKIEYQGKDIDDAINLACAKMNVTRDELNIEVVTPGTAGIFGLCRKKAKIQVSKKHSGSIKDDEISASDDLERSITNNRLEKKSSSKISTISEKADAALAKSPSPEVIEEIKGILSKILELMGFPSEINYKIEGSKLRATISGDNSALIIGRDGCIIDAMQYLMRKIISQKYREKIFFSLDSGNYRDTRKNELEETAIKLAEAVKETGKSRTTSALNPAERRIIHVTLQNDETIRSASIGEGLFKKVRVYLPGRGRKKAPRRNSRSGKFRNKNSSRSQNNN